MIVAKALHLTQQELVVVVHDKLHSRREAIQIFFYLFAVERSQYMNVKLRNKHKKNIYSNQYTRNVVVIVCPQYVSSTREIKIITCRISLIFYSNWSKRK